MTRRMVAVGECMAELRGDPSGRYALAFAGDCFNTAYYFKIASGPDWVTAFHSAVGDDAMSAKMTNFMGECGIETSQLRVMEGMSVGLYTIELTNGERAFQYWRSMSAARKMISERTLKAAFSSADLVYFSGITLAIIDEPARIVLMAALDEAREAGKIVAFDPNIRPKLWSDQAVMRFWIKQASLRSTVVLPSFDDERAAFGDKSPQITAKRYRGYGVPHVVVKDGGNPVLTLVDGKLSQFEVTKTDLIIDTTSAGDAFNGAYLALFMDAVSETQAVRYASRMASSVIGEYGAIVPIAKLAH